MANMTQKRDLMAPETEPTDAELEIVMREALNLALARKQQSDIWMRKQLQETVDQVRNAYQAAHP
jgi:hypothetical protein